MVSTPSAISRPTSTLKAALEEALPLGFVCKFRYIQTPSKNCDPLFSTLPGLEEDKTRLSSHFFAVSADGHSPANPNGSESTNVRSSESHQDVISFAVEALVYSSRHLTTLFVSKVDSTSYIGRNRPSPVKTTVTAFLRWLAQQEHLKYPSRKVVISLFARAQAQYLFPGSSDNGVKHVLDDRQLIKWWARVLDPIIPESGDERTRYQGYMIVPGYDTNELRSFMPLSSRLADAPPRWLPGHPLLELARTRGVPENAPPRCLLPRFPDDPKARFMQDLDEEIGIASDTPVTVSPSKRKSGRWNSVKDLSRFWEAMEFRQECSSGRAVGFLWLVIAPEQHVKSDVPIKKPIKTINSSKRQDVKAKNTSKLCRSIKLTGPIVPRPPRIKGGALAASGASSSHSGSKGKTTTDGVFVTREGYDESMQVLVHLDFATLENATRATAKWVAEVTTLCRLSQDFAISVSGRAPVTANAENGSNGVVHVQQGVNDLGGLIRKKRKAPEESEAPATIPVAPTTNILDGSVLRKKPK